MNKIPKVKIIFGRSSKPASKAIRLVTNSRWSHCGLVAGNFVYEAVFPCGVIKTPIDDFKERYNQEWEICEVVVDDVDNCFNTAKSHLGKKYDVLGIFGYLVRMNLSEEDRFQCAEFLADCIGLTRKDKLHKKSPEHIWLDSITIERGCNLN